MCQFMQRQKEEYNKEEEEKQYKIKLTEEHWYIDNPGLDDQIRWEFLSSFVNRKI